MQRVTETGARALHSLHGGRNRSLDVELVELDERVHWLPCGVGRHAGGHGAVTVLVEVGALGAGVAAGIALRLRDEHFRNRLGRLLGVLTWPPAFRATPPHDDDSRITSNSCRPQMGDLSRKVGSRVGWLFVHE